MALILDKTNNPTLVYSDKYGNDYTDPYLVIDEITIDKKNQYTRLVVNIYINENTRLGGIKQPIFNDVFNVNGDKFNEFFTMDTLNTSNVYKQGYLYLNTILYTDWKSDED